MEFIKDVFKLGAKTTAISFGISYGIFLAAFLTPSGKEDKVK